MQSSDPIDSSRQLTEAPSTIKMHYRDAQLSVDELHVNNMPFFTSISNHMHYGTANAIDNMKVETLEKYLQSLMRCYATRGFELVVILVDIHFKTLKDRNKVGTVIRIVSRGEHVKHIERFHRVIEERARFYFAMVPFDVLSRIMVTVTFYANSFVWLKGVSKVLPPLTIVEGLTLDYCLLFRVIYGEHVQTYEGTRNDMTARTVDALALGPNINVQGGIRCYSIGTGRVLQRQWRDVEVTKMPKSIIIRVNCIYKREKLLKGSRFRNKCNIIKGDISTGVCDKPNVEQLNIIPNNSNADDINSSEHEDAEETDVAEGDEETENEEEVNKDDNESRGEALADDGKKYTRHGNEKAAV